MATRDEVYRKFGETAEAAQLFETDLGTALLAVQGLGKKWHISPNPEQARKLLDRIKSSTLGLLLRKLEEFIIYDGDLKTLLKSALATRNGLFHGFFEKHNFRIQNDVGRDLMIDDLEKMHDELFTAWQMASKMSEFLVQQIISDKRSKLKLH